MAMIIEANAYEAERLSRIMQNQERLATLGVLHQKTLMDGAFRVVRHPTKRAGRTKIKGLNPPSRSSPRLSGGAAEFAGLSHEEGAAIERKATVVATGKAVAGGGCSDPRAQSAQQEPATAPPAPRPLTAAEAALRCASQARGSIYDPVAGITCHFCRQKKLCGEADCPRCANRDPDAECVGKSECARCGGGTGRFCRACLLVRYGTTLEQARGAAGGWLCPHCYEADHPEQGWICNSSICMTRRGMKPTGIAIFDAQAQGFASVAHLVAHRLGKPLPPNPTPPPPNPAPPPPPAAAVTRAGGVSNSGASPAVPPRAGERSEGRPPAADKMDAAAAGGVGRNSQSHTAAVGGATGRRRRKQEAAMGQPCAMRQRQDGGCAAAAPTAGGAGIRSVLRSSRAAASSGCRLQ